MYKRQALVGSDGADAGMGIQSAAKAMDLDFRPIGAEEYDFALYPKALELPHIQAFLDVLKSQAFRMKHKAVSYTHLDVYKRQGYG